MGVKISMEKKLVLFGAGNNCRGVIKFLGKENISAIIDNDIMKWGTKLDNIEIISLSQFLSNMRENPVLITTIPYMDQKKIGEQLESVGVKEVYYAPPIQFGFFNDVNQIIEVFKMDKKIPIFYGNNPITDKIIKELKSRKLKYNILEVDEERYPILNNLEEKENIIKREKLSSDSLILITDDKKHDLGTLEVEAINIMDIYREKFLPKYNELKKFKNIHNGERCFIIGNGPSLSVQDLEQLKNNNEVTFGVNRIYKIFDKTEWRPNYYAIVDSVMQKKDFEEIEKYDLFTVFLGSNYTVDVKKLNEKYFCFSRMPNNLNDKNFSENIEEYVYGGGTVVYDVMQIAAYMGFKEIILLGVDMTDVKPNEKRPHFYEEDDEKDNKIGKGTISYALEAFLIAEKYTRNHGIKIMNATRGGNVEVFSRVSFDDLFDK